MSSHLLLWRHAEAEDAHARGDLARALTVRGRAQADAGARWIAALAREHGWKRVEIEASPAVRTRQTAEALAARLSVPVAPAPAIAPGARGADYLALAARAAGDALVLVGHQPSIGEAIAELLVGAPHELRVRKGAVWWFALQPGQTAVLRGAWSPD